MHGGTKPRKEAHCSQQEAIADMLCSYLHREKKCIRSRTGVLELLLLFLLYFPVVTIITQPLDSPLAHLAWHKLVFVMADWE